MARIHTRIAPGVTVSSNVSGKTLGKAVYWTLIGWWLAPLVWACKVVARSYVYAGKALVWLVDVAVHRNAHAATRRLRTEREIRTDDGADIFRPQRRPR